MLLWTPSDLDDFYALVEIIVTNILEHPNDIKFKELKFNNGVIQKRIISRIGGLDVMAAFGFDTLVKDDAKSFEFNGRK